MTESGEIPGDRSRQPENSGRLRFGGVVEGSVRDPYRSFEAWAASEVDPRAHEWLRLSRQVALLSRASAIFILASMVTFWPIFTMVGHVRAAGSLEGWSLIAAYPPWSVIFALVAPVMIYILGYIVSRQMTMMSAAEQIAVAARELVQPDETALYSVESVGAAVRTHMQALNAGIDDALISLASVEAMIRRHVEAIEHAGSTLESRTVGAFDRVANERARLIELTETLNLQADDFATAIAQKAQASIESLGATQDLTAEAEARLEDRLSRLENAARQALDSFEALSRALAESDGNLRNTAEAITAANSETRRASAAANAIANEVADSMARNAANVGSIADSAAAQARSAADRAIEIARTESERAADAAVETATREAMRVAEAAARALENVRSATQGAVKTAAIDADRAVSAANLVSDAARKAVEAANLASEDVRRAGETAQRNAEEALAKASETADRVEVRNRELAEARAALEAENARLETLIDEQRKRADRLAEAIATQTERLSKLAETQLREQEAAARIAEAQAALQAHEANMRQRNEDERAARERAARAEAERAQPIREPVQEADAGTPRTAPAGAPPRRPGAAAPGRSAPAAKARADEQSKPEEPAAPTRDRRPAHAPNGARPAERRNKERVSWREILEATDDAEPLDLSGESADKAVGRQAKRNLAETADREAQAVRVIDRLQNFTLNLEARLYGDPPAALIERFQNGDRNLFANRLLRLNENDVKRRIRHEAERDKAFDKAVQEFLHGFERLLEQTTTSQTADEELEEYLGSPLGRVYLLIGATMGFFA